MTFERMLAWLPVRQRRVEAAGVATAVLTGGAGQPLVLLHGGIECGGIYWAPVIDRLVGNHRVVVPDAPGLGESAPFDPLDDERLARWLHELINLTCEARPTLVAHSLFGTLATRLTAHADSLARLIVYNAPGIGRYRMPLGLRIVATWFALRANERNGNRFERYALLHREQTRPRDPAGSTRSVRTRARASASSTSSGHCAPCSRSGRCASRTPSCDGSASRRRLLWGCYDRMTPPAPARAASTRLGWPLHVVNEAAHAPHLEHPNTFVDRLSDLPTAAPVSRKEAVG
jgi:pimeloyl-ACP methyl ester carboxylesterase